jgi:hypothetical protein
MPFDWGPVDVRVRAILSLLIARVKDRFPTVLGGIYSVTNPSVSEHYSIAASFTFDAHASDEEILIVKLSCSRAIRTRPAEVQSLSRGPEADDWIDFVIAEGSNDFGRLETAVLPGNALDPTPAYERAVESYVESVDEFLRSQIDMILERLTFLRVLSSDE